MHTPECIAEVKRIDDAQAAFDLKHPAYCRACGGLGAVEWSDRDVGIFSALDPCSTCEGSSDGATCALCGQSGDFTERTLSLDEDDQRPCGCPVTEYRPEHDGPCVCVYGLEDLPDTRGADRDQDGVEITDSGEYDFAQDDFAFDAFREQQATRSGRGRD